MGLEIRQSLTLSQQLVMTPQLQQAIKLLQLSRLELQETIAEELETNPVLEDASGQETDEYAREGEESEKPPLVVPEVREVRVEERAREDVDWESYLSEYNTEWSSHDHEERDEVPMENLLTRRPNLEAHLGWQINLSDMDETKREILDHIIGNLNEDGYLEATVEDLVNASGHSEEEILEALKFVQNLDPIGVAARDMKECLLIQARAQGLGGTLVEKILLSHLGDLESKRYERITKALSVTIEDVLHAVTVIQGFEPKPGRGYSEEEPTYIVPDIYIFKVGDTYQIVQNEDGLPKLRVNGYYKDVLRRRDAVSENARAYIQDRLKSATWLIKSIQQRQRTIYKVTESIVQFQRAFLDEGITKLKPLVLRDVAEAIGMHESTVSRVTTNKYIHTPQGIFELKFFFNSPIRRFKGEAVASESVKDFIRKIVKTEDRANPYSDDEIAEILKRHNFDVARRTVAKYREASGILPSRKRRNPY